MTSDTTWQTKAACRGLPPEMFHPNRGQTNKGAKAVCMNCPVKQECLEEALADRSLLGIRGGLSEKDRRREWLRRRVNANRMQSAA